MMNDEQLKQRDAGLRRVILTAVKLSQDFAAKGGLSGDALMAQMNSTLAWDMGIEDADAIRLIREMQRAGYVDVQGVARSASLQLRDFALVRITDKGQDLWAEKLPADPLVHDDRVEL